MAESVSAGYDPLGYWERRAVENGRLYVAKGNQQDHFDREYRSLGAVLAVLFRPGPASVLDFGCGAGRFTTLLSALADGSYVGADIAPSGVELAAVDHPGLDFHVVTPHRLPFHDGEFQRVAAVMAFQHMVEDLDWVGWAEEARRVLQRGGYLLLLDRDPWPDGGKPERLAHMNPRGWRPFEQLGFELEELRRVDDDYFGARLVAR